MATACEIIQAFYIAGPNKPFYLPLNVEYGPWSAERYNKELNLALHKLRPKKIIITWNAKCCVTYEYLTRFFLRFKVTSFSEIEIIINSESEFIDNFATLLRIKKHFDKTKNNPWKINIRVEIKNYTAHITPEKLIERMEKKQPGDTITLPSSVCYRTHAKAMTEEEYSNRIEQHLKNNQPTNVYINWNTGIAASTLSIKKWLCLFTKLNVPRIDIDMNHAHAKKNLGSIIQVIGELKQEYLTTHIEITELRTQIHHATRGNGRSLKKAKNAPKKLSSSRLWQHSKTSADIEEEMYQRDCFNQML